MLGEDHKLHRIEVSPECAGILAAALAAEVEKLDADGREQQHIRPTAMQTARTGDGEPMILMTLANGAELPLVFKPESLGTIISELEALQRVLQGSQIRWS
jgi:hypothetical protein